jgi:hypothetical protein
MDEKEMDETVRRLVDALRDSLVLLLRLSRSGSLR